MMPLVSFLLKANLTMIILYGFYFMFFRRNTFYVQNRWYLLATMISVFAFPFIDISSWLTGNSTTLNVSQYVPNVDDLQYYVFVQPKAENTVLPATTQTIPIGSILLWSWVLVAALLVGRRIYQFECIFRLWRNNPKKQNGKYTIVCIDKNIQPFSFSGYIFLNSSLHEKEELDEIMTHEELHCQQGHTFDILMAETLVCLFWFNPFAWLLRQDVKQNIEFYTDRMTLKSGFDRKHYQYNLLRVSDSNFQIVNNFHFNNLKKRIIMMNKKESPRIMSAKYLLVIPLMAAVILTLQTSDLQAKETNISNEVYQEPVEFYQNPETANLFTQERIVSVNEPTVEAGLKESINAFLKEKTEAETSNPSNLQSVNQIISGKVTDKDGKALPGVSVIVKGSTTGTVTDMDGNYKIYVPTEATLRFSFINMNPVDVVVGNHEVINVSMEQGERITAGEVVEVIGARRMNELSLNNKIIIRTQSNNQGKPLYILDGKEVEELSKVYPDDIESISILKDKPATELYGEKAKNGVLLITTKKKTLDSTQEVVKVVGAGRMNELSLNNIIIRAQSGNQGKPLFVIDGEESSGEVFSKIDPKTIESVSILKDPATIIYGEKGKNGVVLITTKNKEK